MYDYGDACQALLPALRSPRGGRPALTPETAPYLGWWVCRLLVLPLDVYSSLDSRFDLSIEKRCWFCGIFDPCEVPQMIEDGDGTKVMKTVMVYSRVVD